MSEQAENIERVRAKSWTEAEGREWLGFDRIDGSAKDSLVYSSFEQDKTGVVAESRDFVCAVFQTFKSFLRCRSSQTLGEVTGQPMTTPLLCDADGPFNKPLGRAKFVDEKYACDGNERSKYGHSLMDTNGKDQRKETEYQYTQYQWAALERYH
jgi:hypothetical protein